MAKVTLKRLLIITLISSGAAFILLLLVASPLLKILVEKYDVTYTGREITMDYAIVNPLTGYVHFGNLVIYEKNSDSIALSAKGLTANMAMLKMLTNVYEISSVTLNKPKGIAIQYQDSFNFSDVIRKFSKSLPDSVPVDIKPKKTVKFNLRNIKIKDGEFQFIEDNSPINHSIKHVNISSKGIIHNVDTFPILYSIESGNGTGKLSGSLTINLRNDDYKLALLIEKLDLEIVNQYIKDISNYGTFSAMLDANIYSNGNFSSADSTEVAGSIEVFDFRFGKNPQENVVSFDKLSISIQELSAKKLIYNFDSIILIKPFLNYEQYDQLDNLQTMFGKDGGNIAAADAAPGKFNLVIEIAKLINSLSVNFFSSNYRIGKIDVKNGHFEYNDYTQSDKFSIALQPFNLYADSIDKAHNRVQLTLESGLLPHGNLNLSISVNPKDSSYFDLNYHLSHVPLTMFNPYITAYTSYPLDRGSLDLKGKWDVKDGKIKSTNHLIILDPRLAKSKKHQDNKWLPTPLALAFVREKGNVIDYEIPITGDLNNPRFHLWDIVLDLIRNIFVKPVTTPYRMEVKAAEQNIEDIMAMKWEMQSSVTTKSQNAFIEEIAKFLKENPSSNIMIKPIYFIMKEKELILLFEAKKKYYLSKRKTETEFGKDDSLKIIQMSIRDEGFLAFLDEKSTDPTIFTIQQKSAEIISSSLVNKRYDELNAARKANFMRAFQSQNVTNQVQFSKPVENVPFNGFSNYNIVYKGEIPKYLQESYNKMRDLDKEQPREKYTKKRTDKKKIDANN